MAHDRRQTENLPFVLNIIDSQFLIHLFIRAAANEIQALPDVSALCAAVRPSLSVDRELCWREEPSLVCSLPGCSAAGPAVGAAHRLVSETPSPFTVKDTQSDV